MGKKKAATKDADHEALSFEESLQELEGIVRQLEEGELSMDDALTAYERGIARLKRCYHLLEAAEQKIELLISVDEDGQGTTRPLPDDP